MLDQSIQTVFYLKFDMKMTLYEIRHQRRVVKRRQLCTAHSCWRASVWLFCLVPGAESCISYIYYIIYDIHVLYITYAMYNNNFIHI